MVFSVLIAQIGPWTCLTKGSEIAFWEGSVTEERAVLRQTSSSQDFFSEKGRSETGPLGRVISESCLRNLEPGSRSQKMLSRSDHPTNSISSIVRNAQVTPTPTYKAKI